MKRPYGAHNIASAEKDQEIIVYELQQWKCSVLLQAGHTTHFPR